MGGICRNGFRTLRAPVAVGVLAALALGTNCGGVHVPADGRVTGRVTYLQRTALTPTAIVQVELVDVSRADAPVVVLAEQTIRPQHQVPIPFELAYDPSTIDPTHDYAVQARISDRDRLAFMTDRTFPVITHGAPTTVELVVRPVAGP